MKQGYLPLVCLSNKVVLIFNIYSLRMTRRSDAINAQMPLQILSLYISWYH